MDKPRIEAAIREINRGKKGIISPFFSYYLDYPYGMTPLNKTYNYNPIDRKIKNIDTVAGVEAPIWTEYINNFVDSALKRDFT